MSKPYIERRYVSLEEEDERTLYGGVVSDSWVASIDGYLTPSKETVRISRRGVTANEALEALRAAVEQQGWELR